jgi:hypothetical protein
VHLLTESTDFTTSVSTSVPPSACANHPDGLARVSIRASLAVTNVKLVRAQASGDTTSNCGRRSQIASTVSRSRPSSTRRSLRCTVACRRICNRWNRFDESCDRRMCQTLVSCSLR